MLSLYTLSNLGIHIVPMWSQFLLQLQQTVNAPSHYTEFQNSQLEREICPTSSFNLPRYIGIAHLDDIERKLQYMKVFSRIKVQVVILHQNGNIPIQNKMKMNRVAYIIGLNCTSISLSFKIMTNQQQWLQLVHGFSGHATPIWANLENLSCSL